jgi:hypothetical protein
MYCTEMYIYCIGMYSGWTQSWKQFLKDMHFFINVEFGHHLPLIQLVFFME